jgi:hypothetical protein
LVVSNKTLENQSVECKYRDNDNLELVKLDQIVTKLSK